MNVAIVTGASHGIGAGLVAGFRGAGYAVLADRRIGEGRERRDPDFLAVPGQVHRGATA